MSSKIYSITIPDIHLPAFVSDHISYFGDFDDICNFIDRHNSLDKQSDLTKAFNAYVSGKFKTKYNGVRLINDAKILYRRIFSGKDIKWEHKNTWGWPYKMHADEYEIECIWIEDCEKRLFRCIRPIFKNLKYQGEIYLEYRPFTMLWGFPGVVYFDNNNDNTISTGLFMPDKYFTNMKELKENYKSRKEDFDFTMFCNEIFGDG